ncbi:long-chain-fatty-acid--CoA ligase [Caulobacter sp. RL271]|jgi:fatty-acyl-CoA synthase|uniref:Long-chain-fatty-acid--CoA ligase n=1 Tax=Caulobacter segnis TaxID=88688 RepID=A0ABY4ZRI2_9CAUL|nr:long-chain-fatty-acid--CoA ligase [Caulobacter segnis]USQ95417.1 long-chain-fatty-acid--CoA ligase [Caulobacter segnis]
MALRFADPAPNAYGYPLLIRQLLQSALDARSGREIVGSDGRRHGYEALAHRVGRLAAVLAAHGVDQGDVVAVMDWDSHRYLEAYFAVPMMGAMLQTVNVRLSRDQIAYTLKDTQPRAMIVHADFVEDLQALRPAIEPDCVIITCHDGQPASLDDAVGDYEQLLSAGAETFAFVDFDENALATTFHTTGTTGMPKAVTFSHRQLVLHTLAVGFAMGQQPDNQGLGRESVYMPITPMFHVHAWGLPYLATLLGLKQVYPGRYVPARLLALQREEGVTYSHCVPTILQMLLDEAGPDAWLGPWTIIIGGSALPATLLRAAAARGIIAVAGYGMSETGPVLTLSRHENDDSRPGETVRRWAGRPIPLVQIRLHDDNGEDVSGAANEQGEIVVRAPWLTQAYPNSAAASAALWAGGWLHTQDVASRETHGDIVIRDRLKDVIKTGGEWVSSAEIEDLALQDPDIAEAAVVGAPDPRWGERPVLFAVPRPGRTPRLQTLKDRMSPLVAAGHLSRWAAPDRLILIDALPRTSVGKIDKKQLRLRLGDDVLDSGRGAS